MTQFKLEKSLLSRTEVAVLKKLFFEREATNETLKLTQSKLGENVHLLYNDQEANRIFALLTPLAEEIFGVSLIPTYTCMRRYFKNQTLEKHTDRDSCEYSVTINLAASTNKNWPIWFQINNKDVQFDLTPGDGCFYKGIELTHWRDKCPTDWYLQIFCHWVDPNGPFKHHANDGVIKKMLSN